MAFLPGTIDVLLIFSPFSKFQELQITDTSVFATEHTLC